MPWRIHCLFYWSAYWLVLMMELLSWLKSLSFITVLCFVIKKFLQCSIWVLLLLYISSLVANVLIMLVFCYSIFIPFHFRKSAAILFVFDFWSINIHPVQRWINEICHFGYYQIRFYQLKEKSHAFPVWLIFNW